MAMDTCSGGPAGLLWRPIRADNAAMEVEPKKVEPKRKRGWLQVSLRALLIGVAIVAVSAAIISDCRTSLRGNSYRPSNQV